mmetsp:Transcript_5300/g.10137  ORF Transcript_5300/g.10137 Transcript_5300/m.10137 type:complete len:109 (-) Transcript_5300:123-449(-)
MTTKQNEMHCTLLILRSIDIEERREMRSQEGVLWMLRNGGGIVRCGRRRRRRQAHGERSAAELRYGGPRSDPGCSGGPSHPGTCAVWGQHHLVSSGKGSSKPEPFPRM